MRFSLSVHCVCVCGGGGGAGGRTAKLGWDLLVCGVRALDEDDAVVHESGIATKRTHQL